MTNKNLLRILFVEDLPSDVDLAVLELRKEGLRFEHQRVDTRDDFIKALKEFIPDIVISDYMMPSYNGMEALKDAREVDPSLPFILFTGSMNEETAVECLKAGAVDYAIKEHMTRLPFAVKEALEQHRIQIEKRAAELLLKENEEKLQSIFSAAPVGIGLVVNQVFIEVNDTFCKMTGYNRQELIGKTAEMIYAADEQNESAGIVIYKHFAEKGTGSVETRFRCKDGRILNIFLSSSPLDKGDLTKGVTFIAMDITEKIQAEEALVKGEYLIHSLMNTLPDHIYFKDLKSRFIRINKAQAHFFGLNDPMQAVGKTDSDFFTEEHAEQAYKDEQTIIRTGQPMSMEERETHLNRPDTWVSTVKLPLHDKDGNIIGTFGISRDITERKLVEETLKDERNMLRTLVDLLPTHIFVKDRESRFLMANVACARFMGATSAQELIGKTDAEFYQHEAAAGFRSDELDVLEGIPVVDKEEGSNSPTGTPRNLLTTKVPLRDGKGNIVGLVGASFDITEARLADKALRESEEKYRRIFENVQDLFFESSIEGMMLEVSPSVELISKGQYKMDDVIGQSMFDFYSDPMEREIFLNVLREHGFVSDFEIILKNHDGSKIPCSISAKITFDEHGSPEKIIGSMRDITDRKSMETVIRESEKRYRELFLNNPVPTYIFDESSLAFVEVNEAAVKNYGYSREEFASMTLKDIRAPEDVPALLESVKELGKVAFHSISMRHRSKDGKVFPVEIISHSLPEKNGRKIRLAMITDITERLKAAEQLKLAKEKAEASDKLKTSFLNNISHEVRTPLNGILGFADILSQPDLSEEDRTFAYSTLHLSSDRLLDTITNYMDISLIISGNITVYKKEFLPAQVLNELLRKFAPVCSEKKLKLSLYIPEQADKLIIISDPEKLNRIVSHLLSNAVKFTEKGSIEFGYTTNSETIEFFVSDTGMGMRKESVGIIFDLFTKEDRGPLKLTEGSGLGLSISKGLIEILGGHVRVETEKGKGSCFFFTIPVGGKIENHNINPVTDKQKKNKLNNYILVAEDDEINFFYLKTMLKQNTSAEIIHASNGREAIEKFKEIPDIGLVLMDIKMPVMDGLEATRQIKAIKRDVPVIAITAYAMAGDETRILDAGCDYYLTKPINKKLLLDKIAEYIIL
jgi:PAS domain S-box-containing protein